MIRPTHRNRLIRPCRKHCLASIGCLISLLSITGERSQVWGQTKQVDTLTVTNESGTGTSVILGKVVDASPDLVKVEEGERTKEIPTHRVQRVQFFDEPSGLATARVHTASGQYQNALDQLKKLTADDSSRDYVKQDLAFYEAYAKGQLAIQGEGETTAAARSLVDFVRKNPKSYHYFRACEAIGHLALYMGRNETATEYFAKLDSARASETKNASWFWQGESLLRQGNSETAYSMFQRAAEAKDARIQALAEIGKARCLADQKKPQEGIELLEKIIQEHSPNDPELFARAYNALGVCYEAAGKTEDAVLAFLHTDLLFARQHDLHAEAQYHLSSLLDKINKPADAAKARQLLKTRYAATIWAKRT